MKIAFVSQPWDVGLPSQGGPTSSIDIWIEQMARRLVEQGHKAIVYCPAKRFNLRVIREQRRGIDYRGMRAVRAEGRLFNLAAKAIYRHPDPRRPPFSRSLYYIGYVLQVAMDIRREKCDIIHVPNLFSFVPLIRRYNPDAKIVLYMGCDWLSQIDHATIEPAVQRSDIILGCSTHVTNLAAERFVESREIFHTVFNGVDAQNFSYKPPDQLQNNKPTVLFVGRITPEKEPHTLIEAFKRVQQSIPDARLEFVGPEYATPKEFIVAISEDPNVTNLARYYDPAYIHAATYSDYLKQMIPADLKDQVVFVGSLPHTEVAERYNAANVLALPSVSEAFGMPLVEAMACGRPVVATRTGGMTDIVEDGKTGFLVEPASPEALANALITILKDQELQKKMGEAGRARVLDMFTWEKIIGDYEQLLGVAQ